MRFGDDVRILVARENGGQSTLDELPADRYCRIKRIPAPGVRNNENVAIECHVAPLSSSCGGEYLGTVTR